MQNVKIIFIPGNGGDGTSLYGWFADIKDHFEKKGIKVLAPVYPDSDLARMEYWLPFLKALEPDENTIFVGHSSGAIAAMRYAEKYPILGSVLVCAYYTDLGLESERLSGYFETPFDWDAIQKNQKWILQFNSTNDPFIEVEEARFVHEKLHSEYYELHQGHFENDSLPELIDALREKLSK